MEKKKIKILHFIPSFASGGAERVLLGYLKDFYNDKDIELYALAFGKSQGSIFDEEIKNLDLNIKYADIDSKTDKLALIKKVIAIKKAVRKIKPDIIHSHLRMVPLVTFATLFNFKLKRIHTIHTVPEIASAGKSKFFDIFCFRYMNILPICLNKQLARDAEKLYGINYCEFLYNGIQIDKYKGFKGKNELRETLNIPLDVFVLGHVGRFVPIKNHKFIIDVFYNIYKKNNNAYLLLVGEGPEMSNIMDKCKTLGIENNVIFTGARNDVPELLQIMDAYIFPSIKEGLGISLIEAQVAGLKCIAADSIPEEAFVSKNLISLPLNCPEKWAEEFLKEESFNSSYTGIENFDIKKVNEKLKKIYLTR